MKYLSTLLAIILLSACTDYKPQIDAYKAEVAKTIQDLPDQYFKAEEKQKYVKMANDRLDSLIKTWGEKVFLDSVAVFRARDKAEKLRVEIEAKRIADSLDNSVREMIGSRVKLTDEVKAKLKPLKVQTDEFKQKSFYHNYKPYGFDNYVSIYLGADTSELWGRFKIGYTNDDWLFIRNYQFLCDGHVYDYTPISEVEHENSGGQIYEYLDDPYNNKVKEIVGAIINSKVAKIRCNGSQFYDDRVITEKEKANLKQMYEILN